MNSKEEFQKTDDAKAFAAMVNHPAHKRACEVALLVFMEDQNPSTDLTSAAANAYRVEGAKMILKKLEALVKLPEPGVDRSKIGHLDYSKA